MLSGVDLCFDIEASFSMSERDANKDIISEESKISPEIRRGSGSDPAHKPLEFRAEVIQYDTCKDPSAPILAYTGDNMNLIFNIPKETFLNLAIAVIGHLDNDSDYKPFESNRSTKQSDNPKRNEKSKSVLNDVVKNLDNDNTNEIVSAYKEDSNESQNTNKDIEISDPLEVREDNYIESKELCGESALNDCDSGKANVNTETNNFEKCSSFQSTFTDSFKNSSTGEKRNDQSSEIDSIDENAQYESNELGNDMESKGDCEITEETFGSKSSNAKCVKQEHNSEDYESEREVDISKEMNLSAHNLDVSDCPELENEWPDIYPYNKTEEIPVTELKSLELKGFLTKYLKLELSNECIVIKVTSDSNVLVDAVKYKEIEKGSISGVGSSEDSSKHFSENESTHYLIDEACAESTIGNDAAAVNEKVCRMNKSVNCEAKDDHAVVSEEATGAEIASELVDGSPNMKPKSLKRESNAKSESEKLIPSDSQILSKTSSDCIDEIVDSNTSNSSEFDSTVNVLAANASSKDEKSCSAGETLEHATLLGNLEFEKISLKIEKKLQELDKNIPSISPTERLRFTLNDSLKNPCSEVEAKKQMDESVCTENLLESEPKTGSLEDSNKAFSESLEEHSKEIISTDGFVAESSKSCLVSSLHDDRNVDSFSVLNDVVRDSNLFSKSDSEPTFSSENKPIVTSSDNCELEDDFSAVGKCISNDLCFKVENVSDNADESLKDIKIEKEISTNISSGHNDSTDSALGNDLHISETEMAKDLNQNESIECISTDSYEILHVQCKFKENEIDGKTLSDVDETSFSTDVNDSSNEQAIDDNGCQKEVINESTKLKASDDLECLAGENTPQNASDSNRDSEEATLKHEQISDTNMSNVNFENSNEGAIKEMDKLGENSKDCNHPEKSELVEAISDLPQYSSAVNIPDKCDSNNAELEVESNEVKDINNGRLETENISGEPDENAGVILSNRMSLKYSTNDHSKLLENKSLVEQDSECIDLVSDTTGYAEKLTENSFASNMDSFMDTTVDTNIESASEGGEFESDDKSIASESDDSKDSEKQVQSLKARKKNICAADEVDCAPTRVRTKKVIPGLSKHVIPENSEVKNEKASKSLGSTLNATGKTAFSARSLRSKSIDQTPQQSKGVLYDKKHVESEETTRRTRAKTPDIISKKDLKTVSRSSPRKLSRAATTESSSAQEEENANSSVAYRSKSRANFDSSISTARRGKRGSKE